MDRDNKTSMLNRYYAFGWHLFISFCVAFLSATLVFVFWYPGALALASGVSEIFLLLLLVDVVLGPLITLVIFNPKKKELKLDLLMVAMIQMAALLYGLHTVFIARPVYVVFAIDRFDLVFANDFTEQKLAQAAKDEYKSLPYLSPKLIVARRPDDVKAQNELLFNSLSGGDDLPYLPRYYVPYPDQTTDIAKRVQPLSALKEFNKNEALMIENLASKYASAKINAGYLPLKGKRSDLVVIVNKDTSEVMEMVALKPWH